MKKFYLLLTLASLFFPIAHAQSERQLVKLSAGENELMLEYDAAGRLSKTIEHSKDETSWIFTDRYEYVPDKIITTHYEEDPEGTVRTSTIENGKVVSEVIKLGTETYTFALTYNTHNQLVKVRNNEHAQQKEYVLSWSGENITSIKEYINGDYWGEIQIEYGSHLSNKYVALFLHPINEILDFENTRALGPIFGGYLGMPIKNLPKDVRYVASPNHAGWMCDSDYTLEYTKEADGTISKVIRRERDETTEIRLEWTTTTGISAPSVLPRTSETYYGINGVRRNTLQKGLNLVQSSDGTTRKVFVR